MTDVTKNNAGLTVEERRARVKGIGGSDVGPMLGLSKYKTPVDLWMVKTGREEPEDIGHLPHIHFGNVLEHVVTEEFTRRTGLEIEPVEYATHPEHKFMIGKADGLVIGENAGFEAKTASAWIQQDWGVSHEENPDEPAEVPLWYATQCAHYMEVYDRPVWYLAVLIGGNDFRWYKLERDPDLANELIRREAEFWAHVEHDTPPEVTNLNDVVTLYPRDKGTPIAASDQVLRWMEKLTEAQSAIKQWRKQEEQFKTAIADYMQDNTELVHTDGTVIARFKASEQRRIDTTRLKKEKPEVAAEYQKIIQVRPFRVA